MGCCESYPILDRIEEDGNGNGNNKAIQFRQQLKNDYEDECCQFIIQELKNIDVIFEIVIQPSIDTNVIDLFGMFGKNNRTLLREVNMALAGCSSESIESNYDYSHSICVCIRDRMNPSIVKAAALCVKHQITNTNTNTGDNQEQKEEEVHDHEVLEIIWFVTKVDLEGQGNGTILFSCICHLASLMMMKGKGKGKGKENNNNGIVATSTPQATGFWLRQLDKNRNIAKFKQPCIRHKSLNKKVASPQNLSPTQQRTNNSMGTNFQVTEKPSEELKKFYNDNKGNPYRYKWESTTHIWFKPPPLPPPTSSSYGGKTKNSLFHLKDNNHNINNNNNNNNKVQEKSKLVKSSSGHASIDISDAMKKDHHHKSSRNGKHMQEMSKLKEKGRLVKDSNLAVKAIKDRSISKTTSKKNNQQQTTGSSSSSSTNKSKNKNKLKDKGILVKDSNLAVKAMKDRASETTSKKKLSKNK